MAFMKKSESFTIFLPETPCCHTPPARRRQGPLSLVVLILKKAAIIHHSRA
jgi:hypothetical protein